MVPLSTSYLRLVVKLHEIDVLTGTVLCNFQKIHDACEAGSTCQRGCNVIELNLLQFIYHNTSCTKPVFVTDMNVRLLPDANAAGNFAALYWFSETLRELHTMVPSIDPAVS